MKIEKIKKLLTQAWVDHRKEWIDLHWYDDIEEARASIARRKEINTDKFNYRILSEIRIVAFGATIIRKRVVIEKL